MLAVLAAALEPVPRFMVDRGWNKIAHAEGLDPSDLVRDTMSGLVAFIVPGPDAYSVQQGVSTAEPGGIEANIVDVLIASLDESQPPPPPFPSFSMMVATVLNNIALVINSDPDGSFPSAFARLSFEEKVWVFDYMDADVNLRTLASLLPAFVGFLSYSEAGVFDPETRTLTGQPVGWTLTDYEFAHGHDEFKGYYQNRRRVHQVATP
jgi:hypothetical protein